MMSGGGKPVSEGVIRRIAIETSRDALELPPIFETIDSDALEKVVSRMEEGEVRFTYVGKSVTVTSSGTIEIG